MKTFGTFARCGVATVAAVVLALGSHAQNAARFVGTITAVNGSTLTVKTDAGDLKQVQVGTEAVVKRLAPGEKDLAAAPSIAVSELAVGDRVLVKLDTAATGSMPQASQIVAMKQSDVAQKQQREREDWQKRGVGGLVKSVDASAGSIVVATGAGPSAKNVTVKTTPSTKLLRYAPGSVRFADAKPAGLDTVKPGDQLRARGEKNADGSELTAEEVVSGTFRNVSGVISSIDSSAGTITLKDLATKKPITVHVVQESQMHRMPEMVAKMLAARLNGISVPVGAWQQRGNAGANSAAGANGGAANAAGANAGGRGQGSAAAGSSTAGGRGQWGGNGGNGGAAGFGDPAQMLNRLPVIKVTDLQKGEAVMVVATEGTSDVNAITLLAGVEPLLEAPAATNLLSNWSMGGGGAADAAGTP